MNRKILAAYGAVLLSVSLSHAAVYTVAKNGTGQFTTVQAAVDAAGPRDEIIIMDGETYNEQVTIDSAHSGLRIAGTSDDIRFLPVIMYRDTVHVHPVTNAEAHVAETIDFYTNGAVRIIGAHDVILEGICIDGEEPYAFGYDGIWDAAGQTWPLQHGNAALCMVSAGNTVVRKCDLRNAFFGVYMFDLNAGGIYSIPTLADGSAFVAGEVAQPLSTGNNCIEYCRINDNSFGIMFENNTDMGSTIRYNLFYENHHRTPEFATLVKSLTSEGNNFPGGAILFKNDLLSPVAIYNNTFWHNLFTFVGVWKAGGQHLIFNNIYSSPYVYFGKDAVFGGSTYLDMMKSYANRMHNCVIAAQQQAPTASYISITNDFSQPKAEGDIVTKPFPAVAEIRYLETKFTDTIPLKPAFLMPDWSDTLVKQYVVDQGWEASGVKDPDGSRADLGAIPSGVQAAPPVTLVQPAAPVVIEGDNAYLSFFVNPTGSAVMTDAKATLFGIVRALDTSDVFGSAYKPISINNISMVPLGSYSVTAGVKNSITVPQTTIASTYAFFEMIVEGRDASGSPYTSAVGFLPFRMNEWFIRVEVLDRERKELLHQARVGDTMAVRIEILKSSDGSVYPGKIAHFALSTMSGCPLATPDGAPLDVIDGGIGQVTTIEAVVTAVPPKNHENIVAYGSTDGSDSTPLYSWFQGCSDDITVYDNLMPVIHPHQATPAAGVRYRAEIIDCQGRVFERFDDISHADVSTLTAAGRFNARGICLLRLTDLATGKRHVEKQLFIGREGSREASRIHQ